MHHIKRISPSLHSYLWKISPALVTLSDYIMDPVLTRLYGVQKGYKPIKFSKKNWKKYKIEFAYILSKTAPYKQIPFGRLNTILDGSMTPESGLFIYSLIRETKPKTVFETGISFGFSTAIILSALNMNNNGELYSVDIHNEVGSMTWWVNKKRWHKLIGNPKTILKKSLRKVKNIDIFIHDSDHSYQAMMFEFTTVFPKVVPNGFILSDDIDENNAFLDFAKKEGLKPYAVYSPSKLFGVLKKTK